MNEGCDTGQAGDDGFKACCRHRTNDGREDLQDKVGPLVEKGKLWFAPQGDQQDDDGGIETDDEEQEPRLQNKGPICQIVQLGSVAGSEGSVSFDVLTYQHYIYMGRLHRVMSKIPT